MGSRGTRGSQHYKYFSRRSSRLRFRAREMPRGRDPVIAMRRDGCQARLRLTWAMLRRVTRALRGRRHCARLVSGGASAPRRASARGLGRAPRPCAPPRDAVHSRRGRRLVGVAATSARRFGRRARVGRARVDIPRGCALSAPMQRVRPDPPSLTCGVRARGAAARTPVVARDVPRGEGDAHCAELDSCVRRRRFVGARRGHHR